MLTTTPFSKLDSEDFAPGQLIVGFTDSTSAAQQSQILGMAGTAIVKRYEHVDMVLVQADGDLAAAADYLDDNPHVRFAEPNLKRTLAANPGVFPLDPLFPQQWGMDNGGQIPNFGNAAPIPIPDSDIDAPEAWAISVGTDQVVVAVLDSGVDYDHPDLVQNMWMNPGEIPGNNVDDDGNGYIDDVYGIDPTNFDSDPLDDHGHGTHVSGTIAATGDNNVGVTGVSWNAQIMALKVADAAGAVFSAAVIESLDYTIMMKEQYGINIVVSNHSYGGPLGSVAEELAFQMHAAAGILPAISAGNGATDNDILPAFPANYDIPGSLVVAATDKDDSLAVFSQYGYQNVDLGAPGVDILSTTTSDPLAAMYDPTGYILSDGTSMAAPHVSGAVAVLRSLDPSLSVLEAKDIIMGGVDQVSTLRRLVVSEGRLNLYNSLNMLVAGQVRGHLFNDVNGNGTENINEGGLAGWTVFLDLDSDGRLDSGETSTITDGNGDYILPNVFGAGTYTVSVSKRLSYQQTTPVPTTNSQDVTFEFRDQVLTGVDFGYQPAPATVKGTKWNDLDGNRRRDAGEPGLKNWVIFADTDGDGRLDLGEPQTLTDSLGRYELVNVPATDVTIREVMQPGWVQTYPGGIEYHELTLQPLETRSGVDFGNNQSMANDWGDAPRPYPTLEANNGPRHGQAEGFHLGPAVDNGGAGLDVEVDGFQDPANPNITDDATNVDDEDGIVFLRGPAPGKPGQIEVTVTLSGSPPALLQGWIDFNRDGDWTDSGEQIFENVRLDEGVHVLNYPVPNYASPGASYSRFRYGYETDLGIRGASFVGEVEDHPVDIVSQNPVAVDDDFIVAQNSIANPLDVMDNDIPGFSGRENMQLASLNLLGTAGTAVIDNNGTPGDLTDDFVAYTPVAGSLSSDSFEYTIRDVTSGVSSTATVNVLINELFPVAVDDSYQLSSTTDLPVLDNDRSGPTGQIAIQQLNTAGTLGSAVIVSSGVRYTPPAGYSGVDQFTYTIVDAVGVTDTATVTIHIPVATDQQRVRFRLETTDLQGNVITQIGEGQPFQVRGYIKDMRGTPGYPPLDVQPAQQGIFSAYMDTLYDSGLVTYDGVTQFSSSYTAGRNLNSAVPGILDEIGALQGATSTPLGSQEQLLYTSTFTADAQGVAVFKTDPADDLPLHETSLNTPAAALAVGAIQFGQIALTIVDSGDIVDPPDLVSIELEVTDLNGDPLPGDSVTAGDEFLVRAWVDDIRGDIADTEQGLYSAYLDMVYDAALAMPVESLTNPLGYEISFADEIGNPTFWGSGQKANFSQPGLVDEVGATQGTVAQPFGNEKLLVTIRFAAMDPGNTAGALTFQPEAADGLPLNEVTLINPSPGLTVPSAQIEFVNAPTITVLPPTPPVLFTNPVNRFDVNGDGAPSPLDSLNLINFINENAVGGVVDLQAWMATHGSDALQSYYPDVNEDAYVSAGDVQATIIHLNSLAQLAAGEGESVVAAAAPAAPLPAAAELTVLASPSGMSSGSLESADDEREPLLPAAASPEDPYDLEFSLADDLAEDVASAWGDDALLDALLPRSV